MLRLTTQHCVKIAHHINKVSSNGTHSLVCLCLCGFPRALSSFWSSFPPWKFMPFLLHSAWCRLVLHPPLFVVGQAFLSFQSSHHRKSLSLVILSKHNRCPYVTANCPDRLISQLRERILHSDSSGSGPSSSVWSSQPLSDSVSSSMKEGYRSPSSWTYPADFLVVDIQITFAKWTKFACAIVVRNTTPPHLLAHFI